MSATIYWIRLDHRLADNLALAAAMRAGGPVVPLYVHAPDEETPWAPGAASRWWLHHSLTCFAASLADRGSRLVVREGAADEVVARVARECGATHVVFAERFEPSLREQAKRVEERLRAESVTIERVNAALLRHPESVLTNAGEPYRVFTPYSRAFLSRGEPEAPLAAPARIPAPTRWPKGIAIEELGLLPRIPWDAGIARAWSPGEEGALAHLDRFLEGPVASYAADRDFPATPGVSRLSPHLHFGEISPKQIWAAVRARQARSHELKEGEAESYLRQLIWREFGHQLLHHFPHTPTEAFQASFRRFPWGQDDRALQAWQRGLTGYPMVDAGMRELWQTGWMHNRVRMIVASFLTKHLLLSWVEGARWFWDTLVDADLANNTLGWQWSAGSGADAAPYFRVFNPVLQGERFDPRGTYVRRFVPELAGIPDRFLHRPWEAPPLVLAGAGVQLGSTYPKPIVEHGAARDRALAAYHALRSR